MKHTCENSLKEHTCRGPLYLVRDNKKKKVLCFDSVKKFILIGHDVEIIKNVHRNIPEKKKFIPPDFNNELIL